ncbi:MAG: OmpA family protein [Myxococcota bacterium]|nr:OmpA family protein [Myxococcota bacterium]
MTLKTRAVALGMIVLMSGCFHVTSNLDTKLTPVSQLRATRVADVPVPATEVVTVKTTVDGSTLAIEADFRQQCRNTTFDTWQNFDKTVTTLPRTHWLVFGSGMLAFAGGATSFGVGAMYAQSPSQTEVLDPAVEKDRDTGQMMMLIGGAVAGFGLALLTSELADAIALEDYRTPTDQVVKPTPGEAEVCDEGPAKRHAIHLETLPSKEGAQMRAEVVDLGDSITFDVASAQLRRSARPHLDRTAKFLIEHRDLKLHIEGHTDNTGSVEKNRKLSKRRADAVKRYLVRRGVPGERLITVGMAPSRAGNRHDAGRRAIRRYHFQLLED